MCLKTDAKQTENNPKLLYKTCNAHWYRRLFQYERAVKSPRTDFSSKICSKPHDRGEGAGIYIRTGLEGKQGLGCVTVSQLEYLRVISGPLQLQWGESVCVGVCVLASFRVWKHAWWIRPSVLHFCRFHSFQITFVALDGLLDAQQEGRVPLVQAWDGIELFNLGDRNRKLKMRAQYSYKYIKIIIFFEGIVLIIN